MARGKAIVLYEDEGEFTTKSVVRIGNDFFYKYENGGERGAFDSKSGGMSVFKTTPISRSEARAKLLEMGMDVEEVAEKTEVD